MEHSTLVGFFESFADLDPTFQNRFERQRTFKQTIGERLAFQVFHDEVADPVLLANVVEMADVGMTQTGNGARFAIKAFLGLGLLGQVFG